MSRELKRVPKDFSWPLNKTWGGFLNPYYEQSAECPDCDNGYDRAGGRLDANAALFHAQWYGNAPFDPIKYGAEPITPDNPIIWALARRNLGAASPDFYKSSDEKRASAKFRQAAMEGFPGDDRPLIPFPSFDRETAIAREAKRLYEWCFQGHWNHHLIQADVDALVEHGRLWDFTRYPRDAGQAFVVAVRKAYHDTNSWLPEGNGHHPTAAEVNEWSLQGMGHDGINQAVCSRARCKREGVPYECARCSGSGHIWPTPQIKQKYDDWVEEDPPTGDGYQLWENCSEGSPVSPVFASLDDLCAWAAGGATTFGSFTATKEEWKKMLEEDFVHAQDARGNVFL
jgi:hypothetical protein